MVARSNRTRQALMVLLVGALSGCVAASPDPTAGDVTGTWCGEDGGQLVFAANGTMSGTGLTPRFVNGLVQGLHDSPPSVAPSVSTAGTWRLDNANGMHMLIVRFTSLVGVQPTTALEDMLTMKDTPWTITSYAADPDVDPGYHFTRCVAGAVTTSS